MVLFEIHRYLSVRQTMSLLFISMSFVTPLDCSVVNVRVVDNQSVVMIYSEMRAVVM